MANSDDVVKVIIKSLDASDERWTLSKNRGGAGQHCLVFEHAEVEEFRLWFFGRDGGVRVNTAEWMRPTDITELSLAVDRFIANKNAALAAAQLKDIEETFKQWLN